MGQIRECTICARRMYSSAEGNWSCDSHNRTGCSGKMKLISIKARPRNRFKLDGTKLGEFW